jgi:hypothetical protein
MKTVTLGSAGAVESLVGAGLLGCAVLRCVVALTKTETKV